MHINTQEITSVIKKYLSENQISLDVSEIGYVTQVADGIARVYGLQKTLFGELLEFPNKIYGIVFNLELESIGCVLLGEDSKIKEGDEVKRTRKVMEVGVGEALIGRVVDPLGRPL